jgi:hypothetical protein
MNIDTAVLKPLEPNGIFYPLNLACLEGVVDVDPYYLAQGHRIWLSS